MLFPWVTIFMWKYKT